MQLLDRVIAHFSRQSKPFLITMNILILTVIGLIDYLTGYELSLSLFYLIPVSFAAWFGGRGPGVSISGLSLVTMSITDFVAGKGYPSSFLDVWNLLMHLSFFIAYAMVLSRVKADSDKQAALIQDLQNALDEVKQLSGLLPICASCKKVRDDKGYWNQIEAYISEHSEAQFTHSLCPGCAKKLYPEEYANIAGKEEGRDQETKKSDNTSF